ncbi:DUF916 domain-containing protein [Vagococcus zengguangii]|uniref:DUF916 and DUF3324 domain-containing protein n=1 Tax=Vagococcus zengguangii TaxID=2571750 RepID=A0A4D7CSK2_9ENTE|nr:DUF916 domain-containing protein [Vagococcus zengguangii]QCI85884.1 DUF916 and DUF3324 domain-containing protein [Vagococcus zengguangii]TLG81824.1 DUF916 and DUF3324 domain-containing protein [Vagococcus zengguangii]
MSNKLVRLVLVLLGMILFSNKKEATDTDFSVRILPAAHQLEEYHKYFNLLLAPGETDALPIAISNESQQAKVFTITICDASTNSHGIVDYSKDIPTFYDDKRVKVTDLFDKTKMQVTVPAWSEHQLEIPIKMVSQNFDGVILGGVTISEKKESEEMVANLYAYTFAIQIRQNSHEVIPKIHYQKIEVERFGSDYAIAMTLNNPTQTLVAHLKGEFKLSDIQSKKVIYKETRDNLSIAPNNRFKLPIYLDENLKKGHYRYEIILKNTEDEWRFVDDILITSKEENQLHELEERKKINDKLVFYILLTVVFILFLIIMKELRGRSKMKNN